MKVQDHVYRSFTCASWNDVDFIMMHGLMLMDEGNSQPVPLVIHLVNGGTRVLSAVKAGSVFISRICGEFHKLHPNLRVKSLV